MVKFSGRNYYWNNRFKIMQIQLQIMNEIWRMLKELYDTNPAFFGILLFLDLTILYFLIQYILS